ncbi:MAG TPA: hypothetical protein VF589_07935 [Allosphingosinicella sp.]|jgi:hypothetical protein
MANTLPRRFVMVAAPSVHAGIGDALRKAFHRPDLWSIKMFEKLIGTLDRK